MSFEQRKKKSNLESQTAVLPPIGAWFDAFVGLLICQLVLFFSSHTKISTMEQKKSQITFAFDFILCSVKRFFIFSCTNRMKLTVEAVELLTSK